MQGGLESERMALDVLGERRTKELKLLENNLKIDISTAKLHRRESEQQIAKAADEKMFALKLELAKEKKVREEEEEKYLAQISE